MATTKASFRTKVRQKVTASTNILTNDILDSLIDDAVVEFSLQFPIPIVRDISADDAIDDNRREYRFPDGGAGDFTLIKQIEYPIGNAPPTILQPGQDYIKSRTINEENNSFPQIIKFLTGTIAAGESFRLTFTGLHTFDQRDFDVEVPDDLTVSRAWEGVVSILTAAHCCRFLATYYANNTSGVIDADTVDYDRKSEQYTLLAAEYQRRYDALAKGMGSAGEEPQAVPAMEIADWDLTMQTGRAYPLRRNR